MCPILVNQLSHKPHLTLLSELSEETVVEDILLVDSLGDLSWLYGVADIVFVSGSWKKTGGHNFVEPGAWGVPLFSGPSLFNFQHVSDIFQQNKALTIVKDPKELSALIISLLEYEGSYRERCNQTLLTSKKFGGTRLAEHWKSFYN